MNNIPLKELALNEQYGVSLWRAYMDTDISLEHPILESITELDAQYHDVVDFKESQETGFYQTPVLHMYRVLSALNPERKPLKFLEWGAGYGANLAIATELGYKSVGIEINESLSQFSKRLAQLVSIGSFIQGSYFSNEYLQKRNEFHDIKKYASESKHKERYSGSKLILTDIQEQDVYEKYAIDISSFDLIYAWPWPEQMPSFLELFSMHAHQEATFLIRETSPIKDEQELLDDLGLRYNRVLGAVADYIAIGKK